LLKIIIDVVIAYKVENDRFLIFHGDRNARLVVVVIVVQLVVIVEFLFVIVVIFTYDIFLGIVRDLKPFSK